MTHAFFRRSQLTRTKSRIGWTNGALGTLLAWALSVDAPVGPSTAEADNEIFAAGSTVVVFSQTASGNVAPIRTLSGSGAGGVFVDSINHEVYVTDFSNRAIHVRPRSSVTSSRPPIRRRTPSSGSLPHP